MWVRRIWIETCWVGGVYKVILGMHVENEMSYGLNS